MNVITEAKDLNKITMDELIWNLKKYEMFKNLRNLKGEPKEEKNLVLKVEDKTLRVEDEETSYIAKRVI